MNALTEPAQPTSPARSWSGIPSPLPVPDDVEIRGGLALLAGIDEGPSLDAHRHRYGPLPAVDKLSLVASTERMRVRGRGGAGFPFAIKVGSLARGRPVVVVNASEGEPASAKDSVLSITRPHLVLDGAVIAAKAVGARDIHVILPGERAQVVESLTAAVAERRDGVRIHTRVAAPRFVSGERSAVLELLAGRTGLPVSTWQPESISGHQGRPTLLSNAETWAQIGRLFLVGDEAYAAHGTPREPGTTLLTVWGGPTPVVSEVGYGTPLRDVLPASVADRPLLIGGFHGSWVTALSARSARVSLDSLRAMGTPLGAGVLVPSTGCPVDLTGQVLTYLAGQSARRCGPCFNGLPALATAYAAAAAGTSQPGAIDRVRELAQLVTGRGACAHPDGTVRLVRSLITSFGDEFDAHVEGACTLGGAL